MITEDFIVHFTNTLDSFNIKYLIVGGCASIIYKQKNYTYDLDLLIKPEHENYQNLLKFLKSLNFEFNETDFTNNGIVKIISKPFSIDFHSKLDGINIEKAFKTYKKFKIGNKDLNFMSNALLNKNLKTVEQLINQHGRL